MKVKVISSFRDKYTNVIHHPGKPGEYLDISKERADEILKVGKFIEILKEPEKPTSAGKKKNKKTNEENAG